MTYYIFKNIEKFILLLQEGPVQCRLHKHSPRVQFPLTHSCLQERAKILY